VTVGVSSTASTGGTSAGPVSPPSSWSGTVSGTTPSGFALSAGAADSDRTPLAGRSRYLGRMQSLTARRRRRRRQR
jgi:hypothetical protein